MTGGPDLGPEHPSVALMEELAKRLGPSPLDFGDGTYDDEVFGAVEELLTRALKAAYEAGVADGRPEAFESSGGASTLLPFLAPLLEDLMRHEGDPVVWAPTVRASDLLAGLERSDLAVEAACGALLRAAVRRYVLSSSADKGGSS